MRIICVDRAKGNQAWVQVMSRDLNIMLHVKLIQQPASIEARVHAVDDEGNYIRVLGAGIHRSVLLYIEQFIPRYKREAYGAFMEWEC